MTAEIAVLNRNGVALAADSAVTVGNDPSKIYTSADKLFQLSDRGSVGIMIFGNPNFMGIPWEVIIKTYRDKRKSQSFASLKDYVIDFIKYLKNEKLMFTDNEQRMFVDYIASSFFKYLHEKFLESIEEESSPGHEWSENELKKKFTILIKKQLDKTKEAEKCDNLPTSIEQIIRNKYRNVISAAKKQIFEKFPISELSNRRLSEIISILLTCRRIDQSGLGSGLVIAGYGDREHFPSLVELKIWGKAAGYPIFSTIDKVKIGDKLDACLVPFAQREMVMTFMYGIDPKLEYEIRNMTGLLFNIVASEVLDQVKSKYPRYGKNLQKKVSTSLEKLLPEFHQKLNRIRRDNYSNPVMQMVATLPKEDLGTMADSLVNLTKFKRRVTKEEETVGGPIDVALITKGDGFVWIKRKHYFKPELNLRYFSNILKENLS